MGLSFLKAPVLLGFKGNSKGNNPLRDNPIWGVYIHDYPKLQGSLQFAGEWWSTGRGPTSTLAQPKDNTLDAAWVHGWVGGWETLALQPTSAAGDGEALGLFSSWNTLAL